MPRGIKLSLFSPAALFKFGKRLSFDAVFLPTYFKAIFKKMKKSVLCFALTISLCARLAAQALPYEFVATSAPYQTLSAGATEIPPVALWDQEDAYLPVGFPFHFDNETVSSFYVIGYLGGLSNPSIYVSDSTDVIFGFATEELMQASGTSVRYRTDGAAPNRICKIEWFKAGFYDISGEVTFQIWLYEQDDVIQIRLGPRSIPDPVNTFYNDQSPLIGLMIDYNITDIAYTIGYGHWVVGNPLSPSSLIVLNDTGFEDAPLYGCTGLPAENLVLTYYPAGVLGSGEASAVPTRHFFPNPVLTDELRCADPADDFAGLVQIFDNAGGLVFSREMPPGTNTLSLPPDLAAGLYWLRQTRDGKTTVGKFVKG